MSNVDIFSATEEKKMPIWAKFEKPGDSIQGTYIGKIVGSFDGFGNEQIIYQVLKNNILHNVGFGMNKKLIIQEMEKVNPGQIIGFKYKGTVNVVNKLTGKPIDVKDYGLYADPKIVDEQWLKENNGNITPVTTVDNGFRKAKVEADQEFSNFGASESSPVPTNDVPSSVTPEDKLAIITKLAHDKLGVSDPSIMKEKVMEILEVTFIPSNYDTIIAGLNSINS